MQLFTRKSKRRRRVLVVDDEMINRELLEAILSLNYDVETAANGVEALALLRKYQESGTQFSLILMDLLMPQMSGFRLLEECQADEVLLILRSGLSAPPLPATPLKTELL